MIKWLKILTHGIARLLKMTSQEKVKKLEYKELFDWIFIFFVTSRESFDLTIAFQNLDNKSKTDSKYYQGDFYGLAENLKITRFTNGNNKIKYSSNSDFFNIAIKKLAFLEKPNNFQAVQSPI